MIQQSNTSGMHVWLVLWKAYKAMEIVDKRSIASLGIGVISDFAILEVLLHQGPTPINALGKKIGLTSGSITTAADRAEKKGLITRGPDEKDRRIVILSLTEAGTKLISESMKKHSAVLESMASVLNTEERTTLILLLKKIGYHAQSLA